MRNGLTLRRLILREMQRSKFNTLLCLLSVAVATGLLIAMVSISRSSVDATRKMMKNMGFNLLITPPGVDAARYQALDFDGGDMPEDSVTKLVGSTVLAQHFVGKYQKRIVLDGCTAVLTGVLPEETKHGTTMKPMPTAYVVVSGEVNAGAAIATALNLQPGGSLDILGKAFKVAKVLDEVGTIPEDIRVFAHLHDVQALLGVQGRVNAIDALACQCPAAAEDIERALRDSVHAVLPDVNVQAYRSILIARHKQRHMMYRLELAGLGIVMAAAAAAIWGLTYQNVRNRRREIGVLRAIGVPGWRIAALFIGKILAYSIAGAILGCLLGPPLARWMNVTQTVLTTPSSILLATLLLTPVAAVLFGLPPVAGGLLEETAAVLEEDGS